VFEGRELEQAWSDISSEIRSCRHWAPWKCLFRGVKGHRLEGLCYFYGLLQEVSEVVEADFGIGGFTGFEDVFEQLAFVLLHF